MPTPIRLVGGDVTRVVGVVTCRWEGGMEGRGAQKARERDRESLWDERTLSISHGAVRDARLNDRLAAVAAAAAAAAAAALLPRCQLIEHFTHPSLSLSLSLCLSLCVCVLLGRCFVSFGLFICNALA